MSQITDMKTYLGLQEVSKDPSLWKAIVAEFLGVLFLVLMGCLSCVTGWFDNYHPSVPQIAFAFGLAAAVIIQSICHISGGHINPAITIAFLVSRHISVVRAFLYVLIQCVGAIAGAAILAGLTPYEYHGTLCATSKNYALTNAQGFGIELMITFQLVLITYAVNDRYRTDLKGAGPMFIGIGVAVGALTSAASTGASMNPARSFGPAIISGNWDSHWIYWVGPICGGILASVIYTFLLRAPIPIPRESSNETRTLRDNQSIM